MTSLSRKRQVQDGGGNAPAQCLARGIKVPGSRKSASGEGNSANRILVRPQITDLPRQGTPRETGLAEKSLTVHMIEENWRMGKIWRVLFSPANEGLVVGGGAPSAW